MNLDGTNDHLTIPTGQPEAGDYRIKITSTSSSVHTDTSDNDFWIADVPGSPAE